MPNAYDVITARLIAQLEQGTVPWRKPWKSSAKGAYLPSNFVTGRGYRGINLAMLLSAPYSTPQWMTYKQAQGMGAQVRRGEQGYPVVFWQFDRTAKPAEGEEDERRAPWCKSYTVFNVAQIDGLPADLPFDAPAFEPIEAAQRIADGYLAAGGPALFHGGPQACYRIDVDTVNMPFAGDFVNPELYYSTLFHELGHSTRAAHRLNRERKKGGFGSQPYAQEELVAEFTAAFLCAESGISPEDTEAHNAAYIANWLGVLKNDNRIAVFAAQQAQKAADLIAGRTAVVDVTTSELEVAA